VASEPAYVVGTATIGRSVVSATVARPVVDPPPTLTQDVHAVIRCGLACPFRDVDRDVHHDLAVPDGDGHVSRHLVGRRALSLAGDHHRAGATQTADLVRDVPSSLERGERDALGQRLVREPQAHAASSRLGIVERNRGHRSPPRAVVAPRYAAGEASMRSP
jgi:hypothetical protein